MFIYINTGEGDQIWSSVWETSKQLFCKKWYSWRTLKNRVALDQSNNDPAGTAEQLKEESRGERRTINSHRGPSLSARFTHSLPQMRRKKLCIDENTAGYTEKKNTNYRGGWGGRDMKIPCASETFPVQFTMLHQLFLICCFLHKTVHFYIKTLGFQRVHVWTRVKSRKS